MITITYKPVIIYSPLIVGHYSEYIHHIYEAALRNKRHKFVFLLPLDFAKYKDQYEWKEADNIKIVLVDTQEHMEATRGGILKAALFRCKTLRRYVKKMGAKEVFVTNMGILMPFLPLFMPKGVKVSGIIYRIYLYESNIMPWSYNVQNALKFWMMAKFAAIKTPMLLNDHSAVCYFNRKFGTTKFIDIADPMHLVEGYEPKDIRAELGITLEKKMFVHIGALTERKGTLNILKAIQGMDKKDSCNCTFVFAGIISKQMRPKFYGLLEEVKDKAQIIVKDERVTFETFEDLCYSCDAILLPYSNSCQSSGIIGYASLSGKPVIAPSGGLLGKLIRKYRLGYVGDITPMGLAQRMRDFQPMTVSRQYIDTHTVELFCKTIIDSLQIYRQNEK